MATCVREVVCDDGLDNDGDGLPDCMDEDCCDSSGCVEIDCANGLDDDLDGLADCADPDCSDQGATDADGDGAPLCVDCDDGDPASYPGAPEVCDGVDQNCDGVADNFSTPLGEITLTLGPGNNTLAWSAEADHSAAGYQLVRGDIGTLLAGGDFAASADVCLANEHPLETWTDADQPASGQAWWHLLRGSTCGVRGTFESAARDAGIDAAALVCP
jgi:hypothetical protein